MALAMRGSIVTECSNFDTVDINYYMGRYVVDAKSLMGILSIGLERTANVEVFTEDKRLIDTFIDRIKLWIVEED